MCPHYTKCMFARRRLPCSDMACGLLTVPICRHYNKSMFAMRLAHGTHVPTPDEVHVRLSLAYLLTHAMRPAHGTRLPTTDTAPISRRLLCSHGLRLAHGTRLPTLRKRSRSPPCSHTVCLAHGHLPTCMFGHRVLLRLVPNYQMSCNESCPDWGDMQWQSHAVESA